MDKTILKIAMAAFFHDLGKFVDIQELDLPSGYQKDNAGSFLPSYKGRYSHWHALYTAGFIEKMADILPAELNTGSFGKGDSFIRLAAAHHAPSSVMEFIITLADRISSGMDREQFDADSHEPVHFKDYKKTRLIPVFDHLTLADSPDALKSENCRYRYPLKPVTPATIFPELHEENGQNNRASADVEYKTLFSQFLEQMQQLPHKDENTALWFEYFDSLVREYTSTVPAARVGRVIPDVSLYDHLRTTSAIASAVYLFHEESGSLETRAVNNSEEQKFFLISGSFSGIQPFIFSAGGESSRFRSKLLRGRSFFVSLLTELAAVLLCREIGLPHTSVILNAGGRFTLLAPNTQSARNALERTKKIINDWVIQRTYGEASILFSSIVACPRDFESESFSGLWERLVSDGEKQKFSKVDLSVYGGAVGNYLDSFCNDLPSGICPLCGKRPALKEVKYKDLNCCAQCRDHIFIGENLVKKPYLVISTAKNSGNGKQLVEAVFDEFQLWFSDSDPAGTGNAGQIIKYWCLDALNSPFKGGRVITKLLNGYVPVYGLEDQGEDAEPGMPKTFNDIAETAASKDMGLEALGILKADVDNLGLLMACGLRENLYTVSRLASLSRQMDLFFSLYLPDLLAGSERFQDVYTVFAGGDDLFLIGPWNRIFELAAVLEVRFAAYVCHNAGITFSAGISLQKPHTPIDRLAGCSEAALERSKNSGRDRVTVFDRTVTWDTFKMFSAVREELAQWVDDKWISQVFLYRLNTFINMAEEENLLLEEAGQGIPIEKMACTKWRSQLAYALERNAAPGKDPAQRRDRLDYIRQKIAQWLTTHGADLRIPLWTLQYNRR